MLIGARLINGLLGSAVRPPQEEELQTLQIPQIELRIC